MVYYDATCAEYEYDERVLVASQAGVVRLSDRIYGYMSQRHDNYRDIDMFGKFFTQSIAV